MTWAERKRANWGNTMTDFTYEGFKIQVIDVGGIAIFENPEDLGAVKHGEHRGVRPASMWQWEQFQQLLRHQQVATVAFYQQDFGTEYLKPTRLMLGNLEARHDSFYQGPPHFNDQGFYEGPLQQRSQPHAWWEPRVRDLQQQEQNNGPQRCAVGLQFQFYNSLCRSMQFIMSSQSKGVQYKHPRTRWGAQCKWRSQNTPSSSPMAQKRLEGGANHDNVNHLGKKDSFMTVQGCHLWAGGTWNNEFGARIRFGQNCVGRQ